MRVLKVEFENLEDELDVPQGEGRLAGLPGALSDEPLNLVRCLELDL